MRQILFRGKRIDNGGWVYGSLVNNITVKSELTDTPGKKVCEIITTNNDYDCWEDIIENGNIVEVIPESVGQFTGLKDKEGKDIYENDIVKRTINDGLPSEETKNWRIKWGTWCCMRYSDSENGFGFDFLDARSNCVVIGNITDNPELLKP